MIDELAAERLTWCGLCRGSSHLPLVPTIVGERDRHRGGLAIATCGAVERVARPTSDVRAVDADVSTAVGVSEPRLDLIFKLVLVVLVCRGKRERGQHVEPEGREPGERACGRAADCSRSSDQVAGQGRPT